MARHDDTVRFVDRDGAGNSFQDLPQCPVRASVIASESSESMGRRRFLLMLGALPVCVLVRTPWKPPSSLALKRAMFVRKVAW